MPLDWSLITKLAKLANHNPNDNEANAAARKVCKLLEAGGFDGKTTQHERPRYQPSSPKPPEPSKPPMDPIYDSPDFRDIFNEYFRNRGNPFYREEYAEYEKVRKEEEQQKRDEYKRAADERREEEEKRRAERDREQRDREMRSTYGEPRKHKKNPFGWS